MYIIQYSVFLSVNYKYKKLVYYVDLLCYSYPLVNMPLPGNAPLQFVTPVDAYKIPPSLSLTELREKTAGDMKIPRWVCLWS